MNAIYGNSGHGDLYAHNQPRMSHYASFTHIHYGHCGHEWIILNHYAHTQSFIHKHGWVIHYYDHTIHSSMLMLIHAIMLAQMLLQSSFHKHSHSHNTSFSYAIRNLLILQLFFDALYYYRNNNRKSLILLAFLLFFALQWCLCFSNLLKIKAEYELTLRSVFVPVFTKITVALKRDIA